MGGNSQQTKVSDHVAGILSVALGWGVLLLVCLWWARGFSWWWPLFAVMYAVIHPVIGKLWFWVLNLLYHGALRLWQKQPKKEFTNVVEEMYVSLFWPVIAPFALPILLVAISVGATFRPAVRGEE